ncbi:hypothetical protein CYY_007977 [Polysphondylium violaceum]|uniref:HEPN domain-containing protein n=1 Tax=Polysphondylium violaceum TaxID=133409 RepID=A0A8J4UXB6_9MYCE|nr:hypothetical protein CYY_007977 [Polysphondylium violaceum]
MKFTSGNAVEPYYKRISGILKKYHESTILKELLQNADDARATKVVIKLDNQSYNTDNLFAENDDFKKNMAEMQGPSLLIYNDAVFQEKDWVGIKSLGCGSKEMDLKSVGKFGLGINSVYHASDFLTIVSDQSLLIQDPLGKVSNNGLTMNFVEQPLESQNPNMTAPFKQFGCDMVNPFKGTIIRLPLRKQSSGLKKNPIQDYQPIFTEFIEQLKELLLFLQNISIVEVYFDNTLEFRVSITNHEEITRSGQRTLVQDYVSNIANSMDKYDIITFMNIIKKRNNLPIGTFIMELEYQYQNTKSSIRYCVSQGIVKNGLDKLTINDSNKLIPCGGVAVPLCTDEEMEGFQGIPFTFLPIGSLRYNVPFHFNGFFILSDARTDILFSSTTLEKSEEYLDSKWNENMLINIVPEIYNHNLNYLVTNNLVENIYTFFPVQEYVTEKDKLLSSAVLKRICQSSLFPDIKTKKYYTLQESKCVTSDHNQDICTVLHDRNITIYRLPSNLLKFIQDEGIPLTLVTKEYICVILNQYPLEQFNQSVLDYILSIDIIQRGLLNGLKVFPFVDNSINSIITKGNSFSFYYPDENQSTLLKPRAGKILFDRSKLEKYGTTIINQLSTYYNVLIMGSTDFLSLLKSSFPEIVGISTILSSLPSDFNQEAFWKCSVDKSSISDIVCVPATCRNIKYYVSPSYPELVLNSFGCTIEDIVVNLGYYKVDPSGKHESVVTSLDSYKNFVNGLNTYKVTCLGSSEKNKLRQFLLSSNNNQALSQRVFSLPIFTTSNDGFNSIDDYSTCTSWRDVSKYSNGKEFIIFEDNQSRLSTWPTKILSQIDVISTIILPNSNQYNTYDRISISQLILSDAAIFSEKSIIKQVCWVPNMNDSFSFVNDVFLLSHDKEKLLKYTSNGGNQIILKNLVENKEYFWQQLGVKTMFKNGDSDLIYDCLSNLPSLDLQTIKIAIPEVVDFMVRNQLVKDDFFIIPCVPVKKELSVGSITIPKISTVDFVSLKECYLDKYNDICCSVCNIADISPDCLASIEQYLPTPTINMVINHLQYFINLSKNTTPSPDQTEFSNSIENVVDKIYFQLDCSNDKIDELISKLEWVWVGSKFVSPKIVFQKGLTIDPFIFEIPDSLKKYTTLFSKTKIPMNPSFVHYSNILKHLYYTYSGQPLSLEDFEIAIQAMNNMSKLSPPQELPIIYLPSKDFILFDCKDLIFSQDDDLHPSLKQYSILHRKISLGISKKFKIKTSKDAIRKGKLVGKDFWQYKDIKYTIRNLIEEKYKVEYFLKEMVQNAEDSKATVLEILLDKRKYLIQEHDEDTQPNFKDYLSQSLVVYNDSIFSDEDIEKIQSLGDSNKRSSPLPIGIGFNSVYNFTNVPSLITRDSLYVFDPLENHFSVEESPGRSYEFNIRDQLKDEFQPLNYPNFDLDLDKKYEHTILRLPLRRSPTLLSKQTWDINSIQNIMKQYEKEAENCLLFQKYLKKITFSVIEDDKTNKSEIIFSVERTLKDNSFNSVQKDDSIQSYLNIFDMNNYYRPQPKSFSHYYFMDISKIENQHNKSSKLWFIGWKNGIEKNSILNSIKLEHPIVPFASIAMSVNDKVQGVPFTYINGLPLPIYTQLPVHINGSFILNSSPPDVFNNLPNDYKINLNDLSFMKGTENYKSVWNTEIVRELICPLYLEMMDHQDFKTLFLDRSDLASYFQLFPNSQTRLWSRVTEYFYQNVDKYNVFPLLDLEGEKLYFSWRSTGSLPQGMVSLSNNISLLNNSNIIKILVKDAGHIFMIPDWIYGKMVSKKNLMNPKNVSTFYKNLPVPFKLNRPPKPSLSLKENILDLCKYVTIDYLEGTPFMLLQDGQTCFRFQKNPEKLLYSSEFFSLLPLDDVFVHKDLCNLMFTSYPYSNLVLKLGFPDFFLNHLIPYLRKQTTYQGCLPILTSLKGSWEKFSSEHIQKLKKELFIPVLDNDNNVVNFNPASKYYSETVSSLINPKYHLPDIFYQSENILSNLNIRKSLKPSTIFKEFEALQYNPNETTFNNLYKYMETNLPRENFNEILDKIKFFKIIPCLLYGPTGSILEEFSSLSNSVDHSISILCFTILATRKTEFKLNFVGQNIYYEHFCNLLQNSSEWINNLVGLSSILKEVLSNLVNFDCSDTLPDTTLFPIGSQLVPIKDIICDPQNYYPFFSTVPSDFMYFRHQLEQIGFSKLSDASIVKKLQEMKGYRLDEKGIENLEALIKHLRKEYPPCLPDQTLCLRALTFIYREPETLDLLKRINIKGILYQVHKNFDDTYLFSLTDLVKEYLNEEKSKVKPIDNLIDFFDEKVLQTVSQQLRLINDQNNTLERLQTLKVYSGEIYSKFCFMDIEVTHQPKGSQYIYDPNSNSLYIQSQFCREINFCTYLTRIFSFNASILYKTSTEQEYDEYPFYLYSPGEMVIYRSNEESFENATIVEINNQCENDFMEMKLYFILTPSFEEPISVPQVHLYKIGSSTNYSLLQIEPQAVQTLYNETFGAFGDEFECKRIREFAKLSNIKLSPPKGGPKQFVPKFYTFRSEPKYSQTCTNPTMAASFIETSKMDLQAAQHCHNGGLYYHACLFAQQSVEKLFKSYCFKKGVPFELSRHTILYHLVEEDVDVSSAQLFTNYIPTRYPDGSSRPHYQYSFDDSKIALSTAQDLLKSMNPFL